MAGNFFADDIDGAYEDILEAGALGQIIVAGPDTGPENDPTPGQPVPYDTPALLSNWNRMERENAAILTTDRKFLIPAKGLAITPEPGNKFSFMGGAEARIEDVRTVQPNGIPIIHILQVRG